MNRFLAPLFCIACHVAAPVVAAAECHAAAPLILHMRFADEAPRDAVLESQAAGGLRLKDRATGLAIWSIGPGNGNTQQMANMVAAFGSSLTAMDLNVDGMHDRIYAGDRAGRLWRLDLHNGARPEEWMQVAILANLAAPGRGFAAAPDITRMESADGRSWLNIAIGTANTGTLQADNRFYVLRDALAAAARAAPLTEADLELLTPPHTASSNTRGYYIALGNAQVLAQSLTLGGRTFFTVAETSRNLLADCSISFLPTAAAPLSISVLHALDGALATSDDGPRNLRRALAAELPASAAVELAATPDRDGKLPCHVDAEILPECSLDTRPHRSWWFREDAD